ncbi:MAG: hypothetical protein IPN68_06340 [Bacteroidetes bacterium]|nr:hypothetical protein [Bacteroidota bacterium]
MTGEYICPGFVYYSDVLVNENLFHEGRDSFKLFDNSFPWGWNQSTFIGIAFKLKEFYICPYF